MFNNFRQFLYASSIWKRSIYISGTNMLNLGEADLAKKMMKSFFPEKIMGEKQTKIIGR